MTTLSDFLWKRKKKKKDLTRDAQYHFSPDQDQYMFSLFEYPLKQIRYLQYF